MPVKLGLELMTVVCSHRMNPKWKFFNHIVDKINGVLVRMPLVDLQSAYPGCIIHCGVLKPSDLFPILWGEGEKFDIDLNMMPRNVLLIPFRMDSASPCITRKPVHAVTLEYLTDTSR